MAQQYLPATYNMPRYANTQIGVPFVSAYDPTVNDRYLGLVQQEYQKAFSANQALAAREAEIADIFSIDEAGKEETLGKYRSKIGAIREAYNQDLALAAPQLARAVAEERANPWYGKNVQYNKEFERRQKLLDQFGPNIRITKDLPQGSLNDMDMEDISFNYWNQAMADEMLQRDLGKAASMTRTLSPEPHPDYPDLYAYERTLKGLDETEAAEAAQRGAKRIIQSLENSGVTVDDTMREQIIEHAGLWADKNLRGGITKRPIQIGSMAGGDGGDGSYPSLNVNNWVPAGSISEPSKTQTQARKAGREYIEQYQTEQLDPEAMSAITDSGNSEAVEVKEALDSAPTIDNVVPELQKLFPDLPEEGLEVLKSKLRYEDATLTSVLEDLGMLEVSYDQAPGSASVSLIPTYEFQGEELSQAEFGKRTEKINKKLQEINKYWNSPKGKEIAKRVDNLISPTLSRQRYAFNASKPEFDQSIDYMSGTVIGPLPPQELLERGVKLVNDKGRVKNDNNTKKALEAISNGSMKPTGIYIAGSTTSGKAPEVRLLTPEGEVQVPLRDEFGKQHGMELSLINGDSHLIDEVFDSQYSKRLSKAGGVVPVKELLRDVNEQVLDLVGLENIKKEVRNGVTMYVAPTVEGDITGKTPTELIFRIGLSLADNNLIAANTPLASFLIRSIDIESTPKNRRDALIRILSNLQ